MTLPHFLLLVLAVIFAAGITLYVMFSAGIPQITIVLAALTGAVLVHFSTRHHRDQDHR